MDKRAKSYTIHQVARMAKVSVRTLRYYDQIGLLRPGARSDANYRLYAEEELLRLQQILFYRELGVPLSQIGRILSDPEFDRLNALRAHRAALEAEAERLLTLMTTVDKTILRLTEKNTMLTDEELYAGLDKSTAERWKHEAETTYDPQIMAISRQRFSRMTKEDWERIKREGSEINQRIAALLDRDPGAPDVQAEIARHHAWIENFYPASAELYRGLGELYVNNPEFQANIDKTRPGLAQFLCKAMAIYADRNLG